MCKKALFILLFACCAVSSMAQSLTIVEEFKIIENSSAMVAYYNQIGRASCRERVSVRV